MKKISLPVLLTIAFAFLIGHAAKAQTAAKPVLMPVVNVPWSKSELIEPADLAARIKSKDAKIPLILNIGAVEDIPDAQHIGPVSKQENMQKLREILAAFPKNSEVVIYCGCCPFTKCPNIRPAYNELKSTGFTNIRVLDLPINLHTNWIAKGYPLAVK